MSHTLIRACLAPGLATFLASAALAQDPPTNWQEQQLALPGDVAGNSTAGHFTGDGQADFACIVDGSLTVFYSPASYDYPFQPGGSGTLTSLATHRGIGPAGIDRIVGADSEGLVVWALDPGSGRLVSTRVLDSSVMANARSITTADVNGDGIDELLVVDSGGNAASVWETDGNAGFALRTYHASSETIVSFLAGEWTAAAELAELLVVHPSRLAILDSNTLLELESYSLIGTAQEAVTLHESPETGLAVAILEQRPAGFQWLSLWRAAGMSEPGISLGTMGWVGLTGADPDGNGIDDPILAVTSYPLMVMFLNRVDQNGVTDGPSLDPSIAFTSNYALAGANVSNQTSPVVCEDLDGDGDGDFMIACQDQSTFSFAMNGIVIPQSDQRPNLDLTSFDDFILVEGDPNWKLGVTVVESVSSPIAYTHIDIELRSPEDHASTDRVSIEMPSDGGYVVALLDTGSSSTPFIGEYFVVATPVVRVGGVDVAVGPPTILMETSGEDGPTYRDGASGSVTSKVPIVPRPVGTPPATPPPAPPTSPVSNTGP